MTTKRTKKKSFTDSSCPDCSPFLNWRDGELESVRQSAVVFQSLVATLRLQPTLVASLEAKAVTFLESVHPRKKESAEAFLNNFGRTTDASSTNFTQSIGVLLSTPSQIILTPAMEMLVNLLWLCSAKVQLSLVKADLIPQLINALNPQSLSFAETKDINLHLMRIIFNSLWLAIPNGLEQLGIEDENEQQDVHETILKQVVAPSEQYIWHLCVTRYLIIDGDLSSVFVRLLARLLQICPYYQPTRKFVLHMPVFLTIPSYFSFFEDERSICSFLDEMICTQRECNDKGGEYRQMWKKVLRMLRMEGIEDVMEEKLRNHKNRFFGGRIVAESIGLTNFLGMNL